MSEKSEVARKNRGRGKRAEKAVERRFKGSKRVGTMCGEDVFHPIFSFEVKSRKAFVATSWMIQAIKNCAKDKTPALIVHVSGSRHDKNLVILLQKDFEDFLGGIKNVGGTDREELSKPPELKPIIR